MAVVSTRDFVLVAEVIVEEEHRQAVMVGLMGTSMAMFRIKEQGAVVPAEFLL